ncbi:MAG: pyruvate dehydrogenase (acetyl-transferring) E1 component subunit alpha [Chitinophagales bacterium]
MATKPLNETPQTTFSNDTYLEWYKLMLLLRRFEEKAGQLYGQQKIRGFCHLYIGQEAIAAGIMSAIRPTDAIITAYRDHGIAIAKGISPEACMAELFGKATGCAKGKGGSMHFFSKEHNFYGGHGIVGAQIPMGTGIAFADKYNETGRVCLTMFGDGAARQGALHEAFNLAMLWKLPVVYICENNYYAMGTSVERSSNITDIYKIGLAYDMPSKAVDGMQCETVHEAIAEAVERARSGGGPTFLEIRTYRYKGHSMSDPAKYRTKEEVADYKAHDPINQVKATLLKNGAITEEGLKEIQKDVKAKVAASIKFAEESPYPNDSELFKDIYVQPDYPFITD